MEEYHIVYWDNKANTASVLTFNSKDEAEKEFERLKNGGQIKWDYGQKSIIAVRMKLLKTLENWDYEEKYLRGTGEHFVNTVDSIAEEKKAQDSIKDCFKTKGYPTT